MTDFDMNSFQNVFSACVDEQLLESGWKIGTKREDPKISAQRLKLEPLDARRQNWPSSLHNKLWREPPCKAKRHLKLALPYLTRLLNGESSHQSNK